MCQWAQPKFFLHVFNIVFQFLLYWSSDVFFHFNYSCFKVIWKIRLGWQGNSLSFCHLVPRIIQFFGPGGLNLRVFHLQIIVTMSGVLWSPSSKLPPSSTLPWSLKNKKQQKSTYFHKYEMYTWYILLFIIFIVCLPLLECKFHEVWKLYFVHWYIRDGAVT